MSTLSTLAATAAVFALGASAGQFVMYTPGGDDTSVERIDPILAPGSIGQHVHQVFGSSALASEVTYDSLLKSNCTTVADASNHGNSADHSIYWHPALYMEAANGTGYVKVPTNGHKLYYKDAGSTDDKVASPFEFPHGFRMIAGNPWIRSPPSDLQQQNITQWICHGTNGQNQGTYGGFPTGVTDCPEVDGFNGALHFPHCWNGQDFDQSNPMAHMSYPTGDIENGVCPTSHPTRLPHIFIENTFDIHSVVDQVKPDTFVLAMGDNTGLGWHADFFNGWEDGAIPNILASCPYDLYGNEDVGQCTAFKAASVPADKCKLTGYFPESVDYPGQNLPGCNPIRDTNPAPIYAVAPLGTYSTDCTLAGSGGNSSSGSASSSIIASYPSASPSISSSTARASSSAASASSSAASASSSAASASSSVASASSWVASAKSTRTASSPVASASSSVSPTSTVTTLATSRIASSSSAWWWKNAQVTSSASIATETGYDVVYVTEFVTVTAGGPEKKHAARHLHRHAAH